MITATEIGGGGDGAMGSGATGYDDDDDLRYYK